MRLDLSAAVELAWDETSGERTVVEYKDYSTDTGVWELIEAAVKIAAPLIEAQVRAQIAAEVTGIALEYRATSDEIHRVLMAHEPHDFDADDVTRYGAYASAWESAAHLIARGDS